MEDSNDQGWVPIDVFGASHAWLCDTADIGGHEAESDVAPRSSAAADADLNKWDGTDNLAAWWNEP